MNVAEFILKCVSSFGSEAAFSLTGGMAMHINRAAGQSNLRMLYCNHEQAVVCSADGYARAKEFKVPGIAIVTSGPGVTNTITSVASAYYDSVPLFILSGQVKSSDINKYDVRSYGAQETPHLKLMEQVTKHSFRYSPFEIDDEFLAFKISKALTGRKGPVYIEIPLDVQAQTVENADTRIAEIKKKVLEILRLESIPNEMSIELILSNLRNSKKPVLVIGNGVRISGINRAEIKNLVEKFKIPTLFTWASFDLLDNDHDLYFGCAGGLAPTHSNSIIQSADAILFLGVRLDLLTTAFNPNNYGKNAKRIIVEIDSMEIKKNLKLNNTIFINENVSAIIQKLNDLKIEFNPDSDWLESAKKLRTQDEISEKRVFNDDKLSTYNISRVLSNSKKYNYIVPTASGYAIEGIARFFKAMENTTFAWAGHTLGSMGLGLPSAIGAATALDRTVICLEGDGGILLNLQELLTLSANPDLKLVLMILNNHGYQSIIQSQIRAFKKEFGATENSGLAKPSFNIVSQLAGFDYVKCDSLLQFQNLMSKDLNRCLIDLYIDDDGYRGPSVITKFDENGKPFSTDIQDVVWK